VRRTIILVALLALWVPAAVAAGPKGGRWSGTATHGYNNYKVSSLPISFTFKGSTVEKLTVGPGTVDCQPWNESGFPPVKARLPKLTGFPAEKLQHGDEWDYSFVREGSKFHATTNPVIPQGPIYVGFDAYLDGDKFGQAGPVISVTFGATKSGAVSATGPLGCTGQWANWFARPG
jgi:hypothetical protein